MIDFFVLDSNTSCFCIDASNYECIATCAINVNNSYVLTGKKSASSTLACNNGSNVLGCGIGFQPVYDPWMTVQELDENTCECGGNGICYSLLSRCGTLFGC